MDELEEDPELRSQFMLYKGKNAEQIYRARQKMKEEEMEDDDDTEIKLEELLEEMTLEDRDEGGLDG